MDQDRAAFRPARRGATHRRGDVRGASHPEDRRAMAASAAKVAATHQDEAVNSR